MGKELVQSHRPPRACWVRKRVWWLHGSYTCWTSQVLICKCIWALSSGPGSSLGSWQSEGTSPAWTCARWRVSSGFEEAHFFVVTVFPTDISDLWTSSWCRTWGGATVQDPGACLLPATKSQIYLLENQSQMNSKKCGPSSSWLLEPFCSYKCPSVFFLGSRLSAPLFWVQILLGGILSSASSLILWT